MSLPCLIYCGVLDAELRHLVDAGRLAAELRPVDAGLCTDPRALGQAVLTQLAGWPRRPATLVYGYCWPGIDALAARYGARRVPASNCVAMLLGEAEYARALADGCFFLLPQWAGQWRAVFEERLGLAPAVAPDLLGAELRQAVYLDTGVVEYPAESLAGFAAYSGLPVTRRAIGLGRLLRLLPEACASVETALAAPPDRPDYPVHPCSATPVGVC